ncbi:YybH family protein [Roseateles cellulosilyticus]|uniref:SgcJ/EcaC family oxidoreductase n=1 Tax=Pelomonas cellulosilytica TaxID=2906762 RepID=A0ABS8XWQ7_9BURK|nr:SgcJ/EcaC family oxidoreductase [Pelomonas sp. P8]MCE4556237.1 SgcJ/EcaC family oxidoreductase [Pelomonas sp. P8]
MNADESQIRELVSRWMAATRSGDVDAVLALMADDAVFLVAGRPPMPKDEFAALSRTQAAQGPAMVIDGASDIQEIEVHGDCAFMRAQLHVTVRPPGAAPIERAGPTLTVLRKVAGRWLIARDANLLTPVKPAA